MGRESVRLGREAEGECLGEHEAVDRRLDAGGTGECCTGPREAGLIDGERRVKAFAGREVERVPDMRLRVDIGPGRLRAGLRPRQGEIDAARIDYGEVEQATVGQRLDMGEA